MATSLVDLTPDSLLELPPPEDGKYYELSEGELVVVGSGLARHDRTKRRILKLLFAWETNHALGQVFAESMFVLGQRTARIPDAAVVLNARVSQIPEADVAIAIAPDLAVEVISQGESYYVERKVREYFAAGVEEVWQVYPDEQIVRVRSAGHSEDFESNQVLISRALTSFEATVNTFFAD